MIFPVAFPLVLGLFLLLLVVLVFVVELRILRYAYRTSGVPARYQGVVLAFRRAPRVAYVSGSRGALIGADLLNLPRIGELGAPVVSIGGAGTFDGVFLTGIIAGLLA